MVRLCKTEDGFKVVVLILEMDGTLEDNWIDGDGLVLLLVSLCMSKIKIYLIIYIKSWQTDIC